MHAQPRPTHIVIAGGGVAAVECALALRDLAGDRVRLTIVAPNPDFELHPLRTAEPFSRDHVRRHSLADLAAHVGAELISAAVQRVHADEHRLVAGDRTISYDALVLAVGGRRVPTYRKAMTFSGDTKELDYHGLLRDVDEGYSRAVSFVVPPGTTWPLPLYELALMTAREAWSMGIDNITFQILSPEDAPLALFGFQAAEAMRKLLDTAKITFKGSAYVHETPDHTMRVLPGDERLDRQRVVALPTIEGPHLDGVPADDHGFIAIDDHGRVVGLTDVYAAGDGTTFPVKQGGIACQLADAIAQQLANAAGAPIKPEPFRPVLRGRVLIGRGTQYLEHALHGGDGEGPAPELRLWSVTHKIDGRYLSPWLQAREQHDAAPELQDDDAVPIAVELSASDPARAALALDPYSPGPAR